MSAVWVQLPFAWGTTKWGLCEIGLDKKCDRKANAKMRSAYTFGACQPREMHVGFSESTLFCEKSTS